MQTVVTDEMWQAFMAMLYAAPDVPLEDIVRAALTAALAASPYAECVEALRRCLNYIENTEGEFGITMESGDMARAALAKLDG